VHTRSSTTQHTQISDSRLYYYNLPSSRLAYQSDFITGYGPSGELAPGRLRAFNEEVAALVALVRWSLALLRRWRRGALVRGL